MRTLRARPTGTPGGAQETNLGQLWYMLLDVEGWGCRHLVGRYGRICIPEDREGGGSMLHEEVAWGYQDMMVIY